MDDGTYKWSHFEMQTRQSVSLCCPPHLTQCSGGSLMSVPTPFFWPLLCVLWKPNEAGCHMLSVLIEQNALLGLVLFPSSSIQHLPITFAQTTSHYPTIQIKHHLSYVVKGTQKHVIIFSLLSLRSKLKQQWLQRVRLSLKTLFSSFLSLTGYCIQRAKKTLQPLLSRQTVAEWQVCLGF